MSKKRKTKKEKIATAKRKEILEINTVSSSSTISTPFSYTFTGIETKKAEQAAEKEESKMIHVSSPTAQAVLHDIKHTIIASAIVVALNTLLFVFRNQLFSFLLH